MSLNNTEIWRFFTKTELIRAVMCVLLGICAAIYYRAAFQTHQQEPMNIIIKGQEQPLTAEQINQYIASLERSQNQFETKVIGLEKTLKHTTERAQYHQSQQEQLTKTLKHYSKIHRTRSSVQPKTIHEHGIVLSIEKIQLKRNTGIIEGFVLSEEPEKEIIMPAKSKLFDDAGYDYTLSEITIGHNKSIDGDPYLAYKLPTNVPIKFTMQFKHISSKAKKILALDFVSLIKDRFGQDNLNFTLNNTESSDETKVA